MTTFQIFLDQVDHIGNRLTTCGGLGFIAGASTATYRGLPFLPTSVSMAGSFALTSTACLIPERLIYNASFYILEKQKYDDVGGNSSNSSESTPRTGGEIIERRRLIASHLGGGMMGGTISGSLFQKRFSWGGMAMFTPIMLGVAFMELYLQDYRKQRLKDIMSQ